MKHVSKNTLKLENEEGRSRTPGPMKKNQEEAEKNIKRQKNNMNNN